MVGDRRHVTPKPAYSIRAGDHSTKISTDDQHLPKYHVFAAVCGFGILPDVLAVSDGVQAEAGSNFGGHPAAYSFSIWAVPAKGTEKLETRNMCKMDNFKIYEHIPPRMVKGCEAFLDEVAEDMPVLLRAGACGPANTKGIKNEAGERNRHTHVPQRPLLLTAHRSLDRMAGARQAAAQQPLWA